MLKGAISVIIHFLHLFKPATFPQAYWYDINSSHISVQMQVQHFVLQMSLFIPNHNSIQLRCTEMVAEADISKLQNTTTNTSIMRESTKDHFFFNNVGLVFFKTVILLLLLLLICNVFCTDAEGNKVKQMLSAEIRGVMIYWC